MRRIGRSFPLLVLASLADADDRRASCWTASPLGGAVRGLHLGRPGADLPRAPRDLVGQLDLPLLRPPPVRHRGPVDQRRLARGAVARRVLAPQPPRVPALGVSRSAVVGDRPVGLLISTLEKLGLAWNVVRITPERQLEKTVAAPAHG